MLLTWMELLYYRMLDLIGMQLSGNETERLVIVPQHWTWYAYYLCGRSFLSLTLQKRARSTVAWDQEYCGVCINNLVSMSDAQPSFSMMAWDDDDKKIWMPGVCLAGSSVTAAFGSPKCLGTLQKETKCWVKAKKRTNASVSPVFVFMSCF